MTEFVQTLEARLLGRIAALEQAQEQASREQERVSSALLALYSADGVSGSPRRTHAVAEGTVIELLRSRPGMTTAQLVIATRFSTPKINALMRRLESDRKVQRRGRPIGWYPVARKGSR